jgi:hypothetical protein
MLAACRVALAGREQIDRTATSFLNFLTDQSKTA